MNLITCPQGHYYDADKYPTCPHCNEMSVGFQPTVPADNTEFGTTVMDTSNIYTTTHTEPDTSSIQSTEKITEEPSDIQKTVGYFEDSLGLEPVVGWLVCVEGNHFGKDFRLVSGRNFIGRSKKMEVVLDGDPSVSREAHAIVVYEPKGNTYLMQPGSSKELSYLNDVVVLETKALMANDIITVGATKLMFIPCCSAKFTWDIDKAKKDKE